MEKFNKEELLEKVKELANSENISNAYYEIKKYARNFRSGDDESFYDHELNNKFDEILNDVAKKCGDIKTDVKTKKDEIIAKANELTNSKNFKAASNKMKELMDEWKLAGRLDKETDDELWAKFSEARDSFYTKKQEYFDNLKQTFENNKLSKENIIKEAKDAMDSLDISALNGKMKDLMDNCKAIGSAGKEAEDELWEQFKSIRKDFFAKRDSYYESMKETYAQRTAAKEELIAKAKINLARSEFTDEEIADMEKLKEDWKTIGNAGKENEGDLWAKFSAIQKKYNENKRFYK